LTPRVQINRLLALGPLEFTGQVANLDTYLSHSSLLQKLVTAVLLAVAFFVSAGLMVYLSLRSKEVKVPDLIGKAESDAEKLLETEGLRLKIRTRTTDEKIQANLISEQSPNAGVTVKAGQVVNVTISTGIEARKNEADAKPTPTGTPKPKPKPKPSASPTSEPGKDVATSDDAGKLTKEEPGKGKETTKTINKAGGDAAGKLSPSPASKGKPSPAPTTKASPKPSPKPPGTN
jgi:hypothetical protein